MTQRQKEYREFLKSETWKHFKQRKAKSKITRCAICSSTYQIQLHHLFYRWPWSSAELSDTRWLCSECHETTHDLIKSGQITFPQPKNHNSCFVITKTAVKKARGFGNKNLFYPWKNSK